MFFQEKLYQPESLSRHQNRTRNGEGSMIKRTRFKKISRNVSFIFASYEFKNTFIGY